MSQNILLITTDQHQANTLGCYGAEICQTPHLDKLAEEGTRFTNAFTNTAICTPARTSMMTGYLPFRHGMLANFERNIGYPWEIPDGYPLLPHYLKDNGYVCGNVGKWHIGLERGPDYYGFEGNHYAGWHPPYDHPAYVAYLEKKGLPTFTVRDEVKGNFPNGKPSITQMGVHDAPVEATFCHYLADETMTYLERYNERYQKSGQPFFLSCQFFGPHLPYLLPETILNMYDPSLIAPHPSMAETFANKPTVQKRYNEHWSYDSFSWETWQRVIAAYWGYVTLIDQQIGRILQTLDDCGLADTTTVIFSADHGGFVGNHRLADKGPAMYDDVYRIPMIVRHPSSNAGGVVSDSFVTLMDIMPTVLDIADVDSPDTLDATSYLPVLDDSDAGNHDSVFAEFHGHHFPYPQRMIRTKDFKLVVNPPDVNELYDLCVDPHELNNLYEHPAYEDVKVRLMTRLYRRLHDLGDNFHHWMPTMFLMNLDNQNEFKNEGEIT